MIDEKATFKKFGYYSTDLSSKSAKKIIAVCDDCGKTRVSPKSKYHTLCKSCEEKKREGKNNANWKGGLTKRICKQCGEEFPVPPSRIKKGRGVFCSHKCNGKWQSEHFSGENNSLWKGGKVKRICETCGILFPVKPSEIKKGWGRFCSPECSGKWKSKHWKSENNPNWRDGASFEPYCHKFNNAFKEYIRDKFGRTCFLCQKTEAESGKRLSVHHVNGNKACGCDGDETCQFVPLCKNCHGKVHSKKTDWEARIKDKMQNKLNG